MAGVDRFTAQTLRRTVLTFRDALAAHTPRLNRLNVYPVPDGDTGTNMSRTVDAVVAELDKAPEDLESTAKAISHGSLMGARGNSGVILSQILRGLVGHLGQFADGTATRVASALKAASASAYQAVLKPIEGTILTVVREAADAAGRRADEGGSVGDVLLAAREAGRQALARTPELLPALAEAGVVDAGGAGFMLLLDAAVSVVDGEPLPEPDPADLAGPAPSAAVHPSRAPGTPEGEPSVADLRYEVMFFMDLADGQIDTFKHGWGEIGDSIVVVGGDGLWNCHVHTNDVGAAIEVALDAGGRPKQIRVTDLFEEVAEEHAQREAEMSGEGGDDGPLPEVTCAVVAVASGQGIGSLFRQLGVQVVVAGGQTLNPSTAELLDAVERANAAEVVLLPNNKNIVAVAEQVDALTAKRVRVVPTQSMPEGLAALVAYDPETTAAANHAEMGEAAANVLAGELTQAVRDSSSEVGPINEGDWLGIVRGDGIVAVNDNLLSAAHLLLEHLLGGGRELLTILVGHDAAEAHTAAIHDWLAGEFPEIQVEVHHGDQPLYPYLFGAE